MIRPIIYTNRSPYYNKPFLIEKWKRVDSTIYEYADGPCWVSTYGRAYNENINKIINPKHNVDGYCTIPVRKVTPNGVKYTTVMLSRTILLAFAPVPNSNELEANHNNGDKDNNHILNLSWTTKAENNLFAHMNRLRIQPKGIDHYKTNLTLDEVDIICNLLKQNKQCNEIANIIGCTPQIISHILNGTTFHDKFLEYKLFENAKPRQMNRLSKEQEDMVIQFVKKNKSKYNIKRDLYMNALKYANYDNIDRKDPALIIYVKRLLERNNIN